MLAPEQNSILRLLHRTVAQLESCICCDREREGTSEFCASHRKAYENLLEGFRAWRSAIPSMEAPEFLSKVLGVVGLGIWAADVAKLLLSDLPLAERFADDNSG